MTIKISRIYFGNYFADGAKLTANKYQRVKLLRKPLITAVNSNQGFGQIKGATKKLGANYSPVPVCIFKRSSRQLLWEIQSKPDGSYSFRNIAVGLECFVVAFDPNEEYNAVISDKVVAR